MEWFTRRPGDFMSPSTDDEKLMLVGDGAPDYVRLPPELGGAQLRVLHTHAGACPKCEEGAWHLDLEQGYGVAECASDGFVWYKRRKTP